jgi:hypothetical protein
MKKRERWEPSASGKPVVVAVVNLAVVVVLVASDVVVGGHGGFVGEVVKEVPEVPSVREEYKEGEEE